MLAYYGKFETLTFVGVVKISCYFYPKHASEKNEKRIMKYVCGRCKKQVLVEPVEELWEKVRTFCYLGDRVNASGSCEADVTRARARIGWVKFRECGELLNSKSSR